METWFIAVLLMAIVSITPLGGRASLRRNRYKRAPGDMDGLALVRVRTQPVEARLTRRP